LAGYSDCPYVRTHELMFFVNIFDRKRFLKKNTLSFFEVLDLAHPLQEGQKISVNNEGVINDLRTSELRHGSEKVRLSSDALI
jgi:hypothetical protein